MAAAESLANRRLCVFLPAAAASSAGVCSGPVSDCRAVRAELYGFRRPSVTHRDQTARLQPLPSQRPDMEIR